MRILIIHRSFALVGGAERVIIDKANYLSNQGYEVMLVSYEQGQHPLPYVLQPNVKYIDLDCRFFTLARFSAPIRLIKFVRMKQNLKASLKQTISNYSPGVVVMASDWQFLISTVLFAAGNIFIEESIETPRKKLICDIEVTAIPRKIDDFPDSSIARIANETEVA